MFLLPFLRFLDCYHGCQNGWSDQSYQYGNFSHCGHYGQSYQIRKSGKNALCQLRPMNNVNKSLASSNMSTVFNRNMIKVKKKKKRKKTVYLQLIL